MTEERSWGASYKDALCPVCKKLRPISHTEVCLACWEKGVTPETLLRRGLWSLLPDFENTVRRMTDLTTATSDLQGLITKLKLLLGPPRDEDEAACYLGTTLRQAEDERILGELSHLAEVSMGCQAEGASPCSVCREAESEEKLEPGVEKEPKGLFKVVLHPGTPKPIIVGWDPQPLPDGAVSFYRGEAPLDKVAAEMQSGQTEVDQEAVERVMSELPPAETPKRTSQQWNEMCPTVGWEGEPATPSTCPTCGLPLPPRNKGLLKDGVRVEIPLAECITCGQPDIPQILEDSLATTGSVLPMSPVEVIGRYPEQALKVMQRLASKVPKPFKCSVCGADTPCRHVTVERRRITLCGSTRFKKAWMEWNARLTLQGRVVYSVAMWSHNVRVEPTEEQKRLLDEVHFAKIANSDEVFVLDVGGYIGESTRREIKYAEGLGKPVRYLSQEFPDWTEDDCTLTQAQEPSDDREAIWQGRLEEADRRYERLREENLQLKQALQLAREKEDARK